MVEPTPRVLRNPWWIPPFLGRVPVGVEERHLAVLGVVALALLFESYDMALLTAALGRIARDFGLSEAAQGLFTGSIRLGALPAFFVIPLADRLGRRRLFLVSVAGFSIGAFLTAFAQTPEQFVACQMLSRTFVISASAAAFVIVTEEFPAAHRGWGIGMLGALAAMGHGLSALLYSQVDHLPFGWRALYAFGLAPVLLLPFFRRRVSETRRFHRHAAAAPAERRGNRLLANLQPIVELARSHPKRVIGICTLGLFSTMGHSVAFQFIGAFTQGSHGWSPGQYSAMVFLGGAVGIIGSPLAGRFGDRFGRRLLGFSVLAIYPVFACSFYLGPWWTLYAGWIGMVFCSMASSVIVRGLSNEVFPTSTRATAGGTLMIIETLGAGLGLFLYAGLQSRLAHQGLAISLMSLLTAASTLTLLLFPATHQRELESITGEDPMVETAAASKLDA
jgi:MFS family permease